MRRASHLVPTAISALALGAVLLSCAGCSRPGGGLDEKAVRSAVQDQFGRYPLMHLQDLYKSFFQDRFGPGHILEESDRGSVEAYILRESSGEGPFGGPAAEPCGHRGDYIRVNLSLVRDGTLSPGDLAQALIASARPVDPAEIPQWREEWGRIADIVGGMGLELPAFEAEKSAIDSLLDRGRYAVHHSDAYGEAYQPHYRIVSREAYGELRTKSGGRLPELSSLR